MKLSSTTGGVAVVDDATTPSRKAGQGVSQFFGLNDLIRGRRGISDDLVRLAVALRQRSPRLGLSVNTVVSRQNVDTVASVWERMRPLGLDSWSLTLAGDNFGGRPAGSWLSRRQVEDFYLHTVPALATRLGRERVELVVLPVPFPLQAARVPPTRWGAEAPRLRAELDVEFERYTVGDYNRGFVERCGCPLVGLDLSIGVGGEVYPCSQSPILQPEFAIGDLTTTSLADILAGEPLRAFAAAVPHAPCTRCWAPSNLPRGRLLEVLAPHAPRPAGGPR
ncbi:MAG: radical SAM/SPASM domain-containing protein [Myxococcales bacterium]|nr:MAG: radical SAM/SPASM domain-containing protein [Myxococcales bacterium]